MGKMEHVPAGWNRFENEQGIPYYHHAASNKSIWHHPAVRDPVEPLQPPPPPMSTSMVNSSGHASSGGFSNNRPPPGGLLHSSAMGLVQQGLGGSSSTSPHHDSSNDEQKRLHAAVLGSSLHTPDHWTSWGEKLACLGEDECRGRLRVQWALMASISVVLNGISLVLLVSPPVFKNDQTLRLYGGSLCTSVIFYSACLVTSLTLLIQMDLRSTLDQFADFISIYVYFFGYNTLWLMLGVTLSLLAAAVATQDSYGWSTWAAFMIIGATTALYIGLRVTHMNCEAWLGSNKNYRYLRDHLPTDAKMSVDAWLAMQLRAHASEQQCTAYSSALAEEGCRNIETLALLDPVFIEPILTRAHIRNGNAHLPPYLHLSIISRELSRLRRSFSLL